MTTAKHLLTQMVRNRDSVQHEASVLDFIAKLDTMSATDMIPLYEVLGPIAGLIASHTRVMPKMENAGRTMTIDALGNKQHGVMVSDSVRVIERAG